MLLGEFQAVHNFVGTEENDRRRARVGGRNGERRDRDERSLKNRNRLTTVTFNSGATKTRFSSFSMWWLTDGHSDLDTPPTKEKDES